MQLRELLHGLAFSCEGELGRDIAAVHDDSRRVGPGDVFVAIVGRTSDGREFAARAVGAGAVAVVTDRPLDLPSTVTQIVVPDPAAILGLLVARSLGEPARGMKLIGLTGTNGKTTSTYLLEAMLIASGLVPGVIGTVTYRWPGGQMDAPYTTPTARVLHETMARMRAAGCTHVIMEVTSAALAMHRVAGLEFDVVAFTNLTQDHLDLHASMAAYEAAKRTLFTAHVKDGGTCVVNVDDPAGERMVAGVAAPVMRVSIERPADISVRRGSYGVAGIEAELITPHGSLAVTAPPLIGAYNLANVALCVGIGTALGLAGAAMQAGLAALPGVPGRVERVPNPAGLDIVVDYAHTPDALTNVMRALRPLTQRRLICVFGCGGDRDPTKRPLMGAAVAELADLAIVTSDNPRTEDPRTIIEAILPAVPAAYFVHPDRRIAIRAAVCEAVPGDMVLIAGKGHEDYQIIGTTKTHFDDREEAAAAVAVRPMWRAADLARDAQGALMHVGADLPVSRVGIDSRATAPGDAYVAIQGAVHDGHAFCGAAVAAGARALIVDATRVDEFRHLPAAIIGAADPRASLGHIAAAHRARFGGQVIAITGSSGKTTTKELTRAALTASDATWGSSGSNNNETGLPLTLLGLRSHHRYAVCEMGMRGAGQIAELTAIARPNVAVIVNAGSAHIELLGSTDAIAAAKAEIWQNLGTGVVVRPAEDARLAAWAARLAPNARTITFGESAAANVRLVRYQPTPAGTQIRIRVGLSDRDQASEHDVLLHVLGRHAAVDACCALAAGLGAGAPLADLLRGLAAAQPPPMRGELRTLQGRHVLVDCYNANPDSMAASLTMASEYARGHKLVAVLGDMRELGAAAPTAHAAVAAQCQLLGAHVVGLGDYANVLAQHGEVAQDPADAARRALAATQPGDWILVKASRGLRLEQVAVALAAT